MNMGTQHWLSAAFIQNKPTTHTHTHKKKVHPHHQASKSSSCPPLSAEPPAQLLVLEGQPLHAAPGLGQPALQEVPLLPLLLPPRSQTLEALLHRQVGLTQGLWGFEYAMIVPVKWFELWAFPSPRTALAGLPQYLHPDMSHQEHNDHSPELIRALRRTRKQTSLFVVVVQQQQIRSSNKKKHLPQLWPHHHQSVLPFRSRFSWMRMFICCRVSSSVPDWPGEREMSPFIMGPPDAMTLRGRQSKLGISLPWVLCCKICNRLWEGIHLSTSHLPHKWTDISFHGRF